MTRFDQGISSVLLYCCLAVNLAGAVISGTVQDHSGSATPQAVVEISGAELKAPIAVHCDVEGHFVFPDLKSGTYAVKASADGFEPITLNVELSDVDRRLAVKLEVATLRQEVTVEGKVSGHANNDPIYRQLRDVGTGFCYRIQDFELRYDVGIFHLTRGTLTFLKPANNVVTGAIFIGEGHFRLSAKQEIDQRELTRRTHAEIVDEDFSEVVFRYTGDVGRSFLLGLKEAAREPSAEAVFSQWKDKVRRSWESPLGFSQELLNGSKMDNLDAELLQWVYNPVRAHSLFQAYMRGVKHKDLRFMCRVRGGAIPGLGTPEEIGLVNYDPEGMDDGIWYLEHGQSEFEAGSASSHQERRFVAAHKFKVETVIGGNDHLTSVATVTFQPLLAGERVIRFQLLPNLRVSRVTDTAGKEVFFVQEGRKADGSFYVILPAAAEINQEISLTIEYIGDKVVSKAGNGSFYIGAREAWYPNLNDFQERALYDLTFRIPKKYRLISVGDLESERTEEGQNVTHWTTSKPIAVAGFNYGDYKKVELHDDKVQTTVRGFYLPDLPDTLSHNPAVAAIAPGAMTKYVMDQTRAQLEVCSYFFGKSPFQSISITEQPNFNIGQSWPTLVFLPISAYLDSTQRWMLFGRIDDGFTAFVQEVTAHEVSHQWWGHAVGWATYHDQWLSEGFAEFSAALFLQQAEGPKWEHDYLEFWSRLRRKILEKNQFGVAPNDAGPLWLGLRLISPRTESAYQNVTYCKGAYVLAMLRSIMYTNKDRDKAFIEMMHDFVESHVDKAASTESFKTIAEKHMSPALDLEKNGKLDWFFREWVYGTEVPKYQFAYQLDVSADGRTKLHMTITQSEVSNHFAMLVPVFGDFGKGFVRLGQLPITGNGTKSFDFSLDLQPKKVAINSLREILER